MYYVIALWTKWNDKAFLLYDIANTINKLFNYEENENRPLTTFNNVNNFNKDSSSSDEYKVDLSKLDCFKWKLLF